MEYLDFELPIKDLEEQLQKCQIIGEESEVDVTETCKQIEKKLAEARKEIYGSLTLGSAFSCRGIRIAPTPLTMCGRFVKVLFWSSTVIARLNTTRR